MQSLMVIFVVNNFTCEMYFCGELLYNKLATILTFVAASFQAFSVGTLNIFAV